RGQGPALSAGPLDRVDRAGRRPPGRHRERGGHRHPPRRLRLAPGERRHAGTAGPRPARPGGASEPRRPAATRSGLPVPLLVHPDRWRSIFAGIPSGDFVAAHRACAPELKAWDEAVYGGSPEEVPDAYRRSDPMTYASAVTAPVLVIAGENDPRCPLEGIMPWVEAVRAHGVDVDLQLYPEGHHANAVHERVRHMQL